MRSYLALYLSNKIEIFNEIPDMNTKSRDFYFSLILYGLRSYIDYFPDTESLIFVHRVNLRAFGEPRTDHGLLINKITNITVDDIRNNVSRLVEVHRESIENAIAKAREVGFLIAEKMEIDCPWNGYVEDLLLELEKIKRNLVRYIINKLITLGETVSIKLPLLNEYDYVGLACRVYYLPFFIEIMSESSFEILEIMFKRGNRELFFIPVIYSIQANEGGLRFIWFTNSGIPLENVLWGWYSW
ncbi:hypothetical protein [Pyrococcus abyssi]|uniref:Uncharacterized protein n=1 Tax=Pyrococcus abyssi (strain GE5 / Orsay) TaxID=272844 RepID=G8ZK08_PYRAB|nr:hypothetical protein [Pyrococcus abyssi]CCE71115.1 TPA: hypothetical protein PAB1262.1n [Pyrococcus abyssi GE5]